MSELASPAPQTLSERMKALHGKQPAKALGEKQKLLVPYIDDLTAARKKNTSLVVLAQFMSEELGVAISKENIRYVVEGKHPKTKRIQNRSDSTRETTPAVQRITAATPAAETAPTPVPTAQAASAQAPAHVPPTPTATPQSVTSVPTPPITSRRPSMD